MLAKESLTKAGAEFIAVELDERDDDGNEYDDGPTDGKDIQDALFGMTRFQTVPQVFIGGKFVGGGSDTQKLEQSGKLKGLVRQAVLEAKEAKKAELMARAQAAKEAMTQTKAKIAQAPARQPRR
mmetsp:Transcript_30474/g.96913  ORF Transcript_30474/g.96913 Transcript_30474/m.96913 type:complete len:125 (+) Transcript_30474:215-589(+)